MGGGGTGMVGYSTDARLGVAVLRWFLAFSTCSWNALSEQALHQSCGRQRSKARCVETVCLQGSSGWGIASGQLEGTTENRRGAMDSLHDMNRYLLKEKLVLSETSAL